MKFTQIYCLSSCYGSECSSLYFCILYVQINRVSKHIKQQVMGPGHSNMCLEHDFIYSKVYGLSKYENLSAK